VKLSAQPAPFPLQLDHASRRRRGGRQCAGCECGVARRVLPSEGASEVLTAAAVEFDGGELGLVAAGDALRTPT
jgi:hypothetical protein